MTLNLKEKNRKIGKKTIEVKGLSGKTSRRISESVLRKILEAKEKKLSPKEETTAIARHYLKKYNKTFKNLAK